MLIKERDFGGRINQIGEMLLRTPPSGVRGDTPTCERAGLPDSVLPSASGMRRVRFTRGSDFCQEVEAAQPWFPPLPSNLEVLIKNLRQ